MVRSNSVRTRRQVRFLRRQFLQEDELPFTDLLSKRALLQALADAEVVWKDRIYTPLMTLWVFLSQVLSADHSCRGAVARLIAHRLSQGEPACSSKTGAYCQARKRLPEAFIATIARTVGRRLEDQAEKRWLWKGHHVYMFDGTTTLMPDTVENREAYPLTFNQKEGLPLARVAAVISLSCGVILDLATARYAGKGQGEVTLFRQLASMFSQGDVVLADCLMCNWRNFFELNQRGVHFVTRLNKALRRADFRQGISLGQEDHVVRWPKPHIREVGRAAQRAMPRYVTVREAKIYIKQPGFRTKEIIIVTNLLDPLAYTTEDLADLYRQRWNNELDLRTIKSEMGMECLRCKTPELVHKEIWVHVLAYNLIRTIMAQAATKNDFSPRTISFKGALQTLEAFRPIIATIGSHTTTRELLYKQLLLAIAAHRVADRPNRFEPRRIKRRHKHYVPLAVPRQEAKRQILKGLTKN
jgi:Transposase DDE domain